MAIDARANLIGTLSSPVALYGVLNRAQELFGSVVPLYAQQGQVAEYGNLSGEMTYEGAMSGTLSIPVISGGVPYSGEYEVTPSQQPQTLSTGGKVLSADIVINPIPQNYGLITWNGATLTVS